MDALRPRQRLAVAAMQHALAGLSVAPGDSLQMHGVTDAAEHQQLRRIESPATKNDLPTILPRKVTHAPGGRRALLHRARFVEVLTHRTFHTDGSRRVPILAFGKEHARHLPPIRDEQPVRVLMPGFQQKLPHPEPAARAGLTLVVRLLLAFDPEGNQKHALGSGAAGVHVVEINGLQGPPVQQGALQGHDQHVVLVQHTERSTDNHLDERLVAFRDLKDEKRINKIGRSPALEPMPAVIEHRARIEEQHHPAVDAVKDPEQLVQEPVVGFQILVALKLGKVTAHRPRPPRLVARQFRDVIPVLVIRPDRNHRMMRRASAKTRAARVKNTLLAAARMRVEILYVQRAAGVRIGVPVIFFILRLRRVVLMVTHRKHPAHLRVFRGGGVVAGNFGNFACLGLWITCGLGLGRVFSRLDHQHFFPRQREPRRERPATRAGADDDVVELRHFLILGAGRKWLIHGISFLKAFSERRSGLPFQHPSGTHRTNARGRARSRDTCSPP